ELLGLVVEKDETTEDAEAKGPAKYLTKIAGHIAKCPTFMVRSVEKKRTTSKPAPPFITSTLQQGASSRLGLGAQRTMRLAQTLYDGDNRHADQGRRRGLPRHRSQARLRRVHEGRGREQRRPVAAGTERRQRRLSDRAFSNAALHAAAAAIFRSVAGEGDGKARYWP